MAHAPTPLDAAPVIADLRDFDRRSGNLVERIVFNHRAVFVLLCALITVVLGWQGAKLPINASFDRMIPQDHAYIRNYFENRDSLGGLGNVVRIAIENRNGDIHDPAFLDVTRQVNDALFLTPGVDRSWMRSIWMSAVRWVEVTEEGFRGGPVMPESYDGGAESIEQLKRNIRLSGIRGNMVGNDDRSILIIVPLLDRTPDGAPIDYGVLSGQLEEIRATFGGADADVQIHITGFAKLMGDLIDGLMEVLLYFLVAAAIATAIIYAFTRCVRSTLVVLGCSIVAVIWLLGLEQLLGFELDPYSVLVPFLVFAIGVSHGAQKMNGIMQDVGRGTHRYVAARYTFRRLFLAGFTALLADAVGFGVLMLIDIPVIQGLALTSSIGVAVLIFTNLLLLPVMLSYVGVSPRAAERSLRAEQELANGKRSLWDGLDRFTERSWALPAVIVAVILLVGGYAGALQMKIGDLDPGAPELRPDSRYNRDIAFVNANYRITSDQFVVIAKTAPDQCADYEVMKEIENLTWTLRQVPGVQGTAALSDNIASVISGLQEGNPKWQTVPRNGALIGSAMLWTMNDNPDVVDTACSTVPVFAYLQDHKAETLDRVVQAVEAFAAERNTDRYQFLLAAGPAGIEAVTNIVVADASRAMLLYVYAAVALLCLVTFRSWRAVIVAVFPLVITSMLCEALMAALGIGVKVSTLPVIALGVGIGVDYALYLLSVQLHNQRMGMPLVEAYRKAVGFTGKIVALVGVTLAAGVITWAFSPIKFQADMGILLTFMFLWNMLGALILIPALSCFLLRTPEQARALGAPRTAIPLAQEH